MDWNKLKLFYEVATSGSITSAGEKIGVSQPALSRSILDLEYRLQVILFTRHKGGVALTHEGEILLQHVSRMHAEAGYAEHIQPDHPNASRSKLTVCTTPAIATSWFMKFLPAFLEKYPLVDLELVCESEPKNYQLADVYIQPFVTMQPTLCQYFLMKFTMGLYASQKYIDHFGCPQDSQDLDNHRLISFDSGPRNQLENLNWILKVGHKSSSMRDPYLQFTSADYMLKAAADGLGIVELGKGFPEIMGVDLIEILPNLEGPTAEIYYIYSENKQDHPVIIALLDHITRSTGIAKVRKKKNDYSSMKLNRIG